MTAHTTDIQNHPTMPLQGDHFSDGIRRALDNDVLQVRLKNVLALLRMTRTRNIPPHSPTDEIRDRAKLIRAEVISHLDEYLEQFVKNAEERGTQVHLARTAADARRIMRHKSGEIEALLGYRGRDEMIHRDDLVLTQT